MTFDSSQMFAYLPMLILVGMGCVILIAETFASKESRAGLAWLIGIETMSLAAYVLTGCWRRNLRSSEGAMKYFLMGALATGFMVYGMALIYGTTGGALSYAAVAAKVPEAAQSPVFFLGEYFLL